MPEGSLLAGLALEPFHWWLILAVLLGIGEIIAPGVFLIWVAIAAAITGLSTLALPISPTIQLVLFAGLCLVATYFGRKWYAANPGVSSDPLLNDRAARLMGETVEVVEAISGGKGRVRVGDGVWKAKGPDAPVGARVRVTGNEGTTLVVDSAGG